MEALAAPATLPGGAGQRGRCAFEHNPSQELRVSAAEKRMVATERLCLRGSLAPSRGCESPALAAWLLPGGFL